MSDHWRFHAIDAQPVFTVGAGSRIAEHQTPVPGLYLANMAQIYPQDRGQNYSILLGEKVAEIVAGDLEARAGAGRSLVRRYSFELGRATLSRFLYSSLQSRPVLASGIITATSLSDGPPMQQDFATSSDQGLMAAASALAHRLHLPTTLIKFLMVGGVAFVIFQVFLYLLYGEPPAPLLPRPFRSVLVPS